MLEYRDVYAGGRLVGSGSADVITIVNPATEEVAGAVPSMVGADVEVAVAAARKAFDAGRGRRPARPTGRRRWTGWPRPSRPGPRTPPGW